MKTTGAPRLRTSLSRAPSTASEEELRGRKFLAEREAWRHSGLVVIGIDDLAVPEGLRMLVEAVGVQRYGKRE